MRKPNGYGSVLKLSGNRRKPYAVRVTQGWDTEGKQKYKYLGYFSSRKDAEICLAEYNKYPYDCEDIPLSQLWDMWYNDYLVKKSDKTIRLYSNAWDTAADIHSITLSKVDRKTLQKHIDISHYAYNTARLLRIVLNQMFDYGAKHDLLSPHLATIPSLLIIDTCETTKSILRANFEATEVSLMWGNTKEYSVYLILLYSGLRIGELLALKKEDVHIKEQYFDVKQAKTKAGVRQVPIANKILPLVKEMYDNADDVFCTKSYNAINKYLQRRMNHTLHDTRHTFISWLTEKDVDERVIKQIVGHAGDGVTEAVYTHISLSKKLKAVNLL